MHGRQGPQRGLPQPLRPTPELAHMTVPRNPPYGRMQTIARLPAGSAVPVQVITAPDPAESFYRVSLQGPCTWRIQYGTNSLIEVPDIVSPAHGLIPGACEIWAHPLPDAQANTLALCTLTKAWGDSWGRGNGGFKVYADFATGTALVAPPQAVGYFALTPSTIVIHGVATVVPPLDSVLVESGSTLTVAGNGYWVLRL